MKEKIKEIFKNRIFIFILGGLIFGSVGVTAATYFPSNDVTYDNKESGLSSTDVQGAIDELYGLCFPSKPSAGEQIIEDAGLEKDPYECRYFFKGSNPNNYITFNEEKDEKGAWRIISVECDGTIKIMRATSIGEMTWSTSGNNWAIPASLNTYLKKDYYNNLTSKTKQQIVAKNWSIGAVTYTDNNLAATINKENSIKWTGEIALVTASEYIRSNSNQSNCGTIKQVYNSTTCNDTSWMYNGNEFWTLSPYSGDNTNVFFVRNAGNLEFGNSVLNSFNIHPVVYLSSEVQITDGLGTKNNPYTIE